ncbi:hypothetical protein ABPG72_020338, partial [Tetrahymena utriculariae]
SQSKSVTQVAKTFCKDLAINLKILRRDNDENLINDQFYSNLSKILVRFGKLKNLKLGLNDYKKLLQSSEIINCTNIRVLKLYVQKNISQVQILQYRRLALMIKRLVKFEIYYHCYSDEE